MARAGANQQALGHYIAEHRESRVPHNILEAARLCLADWMAVAIGAGEEPAGRLVRETVAGWRSAGRSSVLYGAPTAAPFAALANGTLAHCLDFDDTHVPSVTHTSAPVWAATLALGEEIGASEGEMLRAFILGFEVAARVGAGLGQGVTARGWHSTGVFGRIGAAAASAALLGLSAGEAVHALGAAATQASGLTASFGTMAKPYHAGKAAMDGVLSAQLAARGFQAGQDLLEPGGALNQAVIQDGTLKITQANFEHWEILANSFKPYAACHLVHPAADAAHALALAPELLASVRASVSPLAMQITGGASGRPLTPLAAKFDLKYCIALALHGRVLSAADFAEPWRLDPAICATAEKVEATAQAGIGFASARLDVDTVDGQQKSAVIAIAKGHPGNPMSWDDMWSKFNGLVERRLVGRTESFFRQLKDFGSGQALIGIREELTQLGRAAQGRQLRASAADSVSPAGRLPS